MDNKNVIIQNYILVINNKCGCQEGQQQFSQQGFKSVGTKQIPKFGKQPLPLPPDLSSSENNENQEQSEYYCKGFLFIVENILDYSYSVFLPHFLKKPKNQIMDTALEYTENIVKVLPIIKGDILPLIQLVINCVKVNLEKVGEDVMKQIDQFSIIIQNIKNKDYKEIIKQACQEHSYYVVKVKDTKLKNQQFVKQLSEKYDKAIKGSNIDPKLNNDEFWKNEYWQKGIDDAKKFLECMLQTPELYSKHFNLQIVISRIFKIYEIFRKYLQFIEFIIQCKEIT